MRITAILLLFSSTHPKDSFVIDASAEIANTVNISRKDLCQFVDDIGLFARHMEGVVAVERLDDDTYLYKTSREVPLRDRMDVNFVIRKTIANDTLTVYRTPNANDPNWMLCHVELCPMSDTQTSITIRLRLRMERKRGSDVHWLAPLVGADFISDRMEGDLESMLWDFAESSTRELYQRFPQPWSRE